MRFFSLASLLYLSSTVANAATIPTVQDLSIRDVPAFEQAYQDLEKRKGGGGGGKGGSGSGGSSSSSGSSSSGSSSSGSGSSSSGSGSRSGSSGGSSSRPASSYPFSSSQNVGGRTRSGSGVAPAYGGGARYAGGAAVPYRSGGRSAGGISPFLFPVAALAFFPGLWLYGAYSYPYNHPYYYHNRTADDTGNNSTNSSVPVECLCQQYQECGCDDTNNSTLVANMMNVTDGDAPVNSSVTRFVDFGNGTQKLFINGTLPNGTTAPGGTEASNASQISSAATAFAQMSGYWVMVASVLAAVMLA